MGAVACLLSIGLTAVFGLAYQRGKAFAIAMALVALAAIIYDETALILN